MRIQRVLTAGLAALALVAAPAATAEATGATSAKQKTTRTFALLHTLTKTRTGWTLTYDPAVLCWTWKALPANCKGKGVKIVRRFDDGFVNNPAISLVRRHANYHTVLTFTDADPRGKRAPLPKHGTRSFLQHGREWMVGWVTTDSHGTVLRIDQQYTP